ncbi:MAG: YIP1 family protein [Dehalococcoidia bacterium]|nr:YIP1 family protein [Dehalococcoidia bacterium]
MQISETPAAPEPAQPASPQPPIPNPPMGFWQAAWGVVVHPQATLSYACRERKLAWGVWALLLMTTPLAVVVLFAPPLEALRLLPIPHEQMRSLLAVIVLFILPLGIFSTALTYHIVAGRLKGSGTLAGIFAGTSMASLPLLLTALLVTLAAVSGPNSQTISVVIIYVIVLWVYVLQVIAIKVNYNMSVGRALAVFLIPAAAAFVLSFILSAVLAAFVILSLGALG